MQFDFYCLYLPYFLEKLFKYIFVLVCLILLNAKSIAQVFHITDSDYACCMMKFEKANGAEQEDAEDECKENECKCESSIYYSLGMPIALNKNKFYLVSLKIKYSRENHIFFSRSISNIPYCPPEIFFV